MIRVPLDQPLDAPLARRGGAGGGLARGGERARRRARRRGRGQTVRARALGEAIVEEATERDADLIVLGSAPRWRRQSRFFSPTVDYVLRKAPCEVMVVAFPQGVLEEDGTSALTLRCA